MPIATLFQRSNHAENTLNALRKSQAVIEFDMAGTILTANQNFLDVMGYSLDEIRGKHHSMFVDPAYRESQAYADFWRRLNNGEHDLAQYKRLGKGGKEVWIEASYNPVHDNNGKPVKVVKYATDVTTQKMEYADLLGQVNAINKSQAVIEFGMDGTILKANDNFLKALGYSLPEIQGKNHSMFVDAAYRASTEYAQFWQRLRNGEYQAGQFRRLGKGGKEIWIEASYNPILDLNGKPFKVVKYATDITSQIQLLTDLKKLIDVNFAEIESALDRTAHEAQNADGAAQETSNNVQTMASAAEELATSVREISQSMTHSMAATDKAVEEVVNADKSTQRLSDAASAMGSIIGMIQAIAGQINLLALNATIESARAGDAGKGFAVVANEVKNLANQAAKATEQISREIGGIQAISNDVVSALDGIRSSMGGVREYVSATASAVEEQSAVTESMSANMQSAASAVAVISANVGEISASVHQAVVAVVKTKDAAQILAR